MNNVQEKCRRHQMDFIFQLIGCIQAYKKNFRMTPHNEQEIKVVFDISIL